MFNEHTGNSESTEKKKKKTPKGKARDKVVNEIEEEVLTKTRRNGRKSKEDEERRKRLMKQKKAEDRRKDKRRDKQDEKRHKKQQQKRDRRRKRKGEEEKDYGNTIGKVKNNIAREKYGKRFSQLPREQKKEIEDEAKDHLHNKKHGKYVDKDGNQVVKKSGKTLKDRLLVRGMKLRLRLFGKKDNDGKVILLTPTRKLWLYFLGIMATMGIFFASAIVMIFLAMAAIAIVIIEDKDLLKSSGGGGKTASKTTEEGSGNVSVGVSGQIDGIEYETFTADGTYKGKVTANTPVSQLPITTVNGITILKPEGMILGGGKVGSSRTSGYSDFFNGIPKGSENSISGLGSTDIYVKGSLASPLPKIQLTSNQMAHRSYSGRPHMGVDLSCTHVSDIDMRAMADGVVRGARNGGGGYGLILDIVYNQQGYNGIMSRYAHLARFYKKAGDKVKQGDKVARCGNTGGSYPVHAHVEMYKPPYTSADLLDVHYYLQIPINHRAGSSNLGLN